jgi:dihydroneopterin aldolase
MPTTKLLLKKMIFYGYHGVFSGERELGQQIEVDVELDADFTAAGRTDDLERTINYSEVYQLVKTVVEEEQYNLIEAIARAILEKIHHAYEVDRITVRVRKPQPPVGGVLDCVEFEISDSKEK